MKPLSNVSSTKGERKCVSVNILLSGGVFNNFAGLIIIIFWF